MKRQLMSLIVVITLAVCAGAEPLRTISVMGAGRVEAVPNLAVVTLSFTNHGASDISRAQLIADIGQKAEPALAAVKELVSGQGTVRASAPVITINREWKRAADGSNEQVTTGKTVQRTIEVTLRGEGAIETKLNKLFDNPAIKADENSDVRFSFSQRREAALQRSALKKAYANAVERAAAQLEPGERLGKAIARGTQASIPSPRPQARAMALAVAPEASGGGAPTIESGKIERSASTNVLFEVKGKPKRSQKGGKKKK